MSIYRRRLMIANTRKEDIPDLSNYPGLIAAWSAAGKSNDDADRNVLRDLTGNGHDITLNGFAFNTEGSGYGHPEYPDALVFDGVDDYGINEEIPILTDYTFISCLKWITEPDAPVYPFAKGNGTANTTIFSGHSSNGRIKALVYNFGFENDVKGYTQELINYQNTTFYNNKNIKKSNIKDLNYPFLLAKFSNSHTPANMAFYSAYLFDRSLDEQEIKAFIRKYIDADYVLPSEQTTE